MPEAAPAVKTTKSSRPYVTIACKIPFAWIDLKIFKPVQVQENTQTGPRMVTQYFATGEVIRIHGTAYPRGEAPEGFGEKPEMIMGYALTKGVSRDLWDRYLDQNEKTPYIANKMIIAYESLDDIRAEATEHKNALTGLEPIQRNKDNIPDPAGAEADEQRAFALGAGPIEEIWHG